MVISGLFIIAGFILLIKGADWLVTGASALAKKYNVSDLVIGLTIVSFGTSAPELVVNTVASVEKHSDIVFGNVLGSNIANLFLILGLVGIVYPVSVQSNTVWKEIPISFLALVALFFLANNFLFQQESIVSRIDGIVLLSMFGGFMYYIYRQMKVERQDTEGIITRQMTGVKIWLFIIFGLAGLFAGGKLVVDFTVKIATILGLSEKLIGLTIIAIGTSLPELVTSVVAAIKKKSDIAVGNIIGSNIFNILLILSVSSLINPIQYNTTFNTELYILAAGTAILFTGMFTLHRRKLDRFEGIILFLSYIGYTIYLLKTSV